MTRSKLWKPAIGLVFFVFILNALARTKADPDLWGYPRQFLEEFPPDMVLVASGSKMHTSLQGGPGWRQVYADPSCALFLRGE